MSESAVEMARENARRNGLEDRMDFVAADVFDLLPEVKKGEYDFIILDPPAFTKSRRTVGRAEKGYKEINLRALKALPRGGYFATASCSHFMPSELFVKMLRSAAQDANVELRQIEARQQAPDHPILWNVPGDGLPEILYFSSCLSLRRTIKRLCTMIRCRAFIN